MHSLRSQNMCVSLYIFEKNEELITNVPTNVIRLKLITQPLYRQIQIHTQKTFQWMNLFSIGRSKLIFGCVCHAYDTLHRKQARSLLNTQDYFSLQFVMPLYNPIFRPFVMHLSLC